MTHSLIHLYIEYLKGVTEKAQKIIYLEFHENKRLINEVSFAIEMYDAQIWIKIKTYKD
jgi:hypothetical protein